MSLLKEVIIVLPLQMRDSKQLHALLEQSRKWWDRDTAHTTERGLSVIFQAGDHTQVVIIIQAKVTVPAFPRMQSQLCT